MKTAREILDAIDALFVEAEEADLRRPFGSSDRAPIVRGPDGGGDVKLATTVPIRAAAFPRTAAWLVAHNRNHSLFIGLTKSSSEIFVPAGGGADHFYAHIIAAAGALGFRISRLNDTGSYWRLP